ncbi:MAG: aminotransferase class V-fold PLP-dependent enzyme [Catalinimonas sp.]
MTTYFPGPSKVYDRLGEYLQDALAAGVPSISHRGAAFVDISRRAIRATKQKLGVPDDYTMLFVSSATESWEIIAQSLLRARSLHVYGGSFGERWFQYTRALHEGALPYVLEPDEEVPVTRLPVDTATELIGITQNETSNGTQVRPAVIRALRDAYPHALLAVDATSAMAGVATDYTTADVWYASVQKCFGLPAGLAVMFCSPRAVARAHEINERDRYNSLTAMLAQIDKWQTTYTPNVLGIYLLMRVMEDAPDIRTTDERLKRRAADLYARVAQRDDLAPLIANAAVRSDTVVTVRADPQVVAHFKGEALAAGLLLGNGYGPLKDSTFRIANFPAHTDTEMAAVGLFLTEAPTLTKV